ncbi:sce7726 family protein [Pedobacter cryoconitis]|nr:sce7726 family protein [Pedobacter cryoconitis]
MDNDTSKVYGRQLKKLLNKNGVTVQGRASFSEMLSLGYQQLLAHYRHEYIYKTAILNSYVLREHSLAETILLNEFKIGTSKADVIVVNGTNKVFEIKTELDTPERLQNQVNDYFKAFTEVYLVVHHSMLAKYLGRVDRHVGIMVFSENGNIDTIYTATPDHSRLDSTIMLKSLRKDEYLNLVRNLNGSIPIAKPVHMFTECCRIAKSFPVQTVHIEFLKIIKQRICKESNEITLDEAIPSYLKFCCYNADLDQNHYIALTKRLNCFI